MQSRDDVPLFPTQPGDYRLRLLTANRLEVWFPNVREHYLITFDPEQPELDIVFLPFDLETMQP